jgi:hypothetical protein
MPTGITIPFGSSADLTLGGPQIISVTSGAGTVTVGTNPVSLERARAMLCTIAATGNTAYRRVNLSKRLHAVASGTLKQNHVAIVIELKGVTFQNTGGDWNDTNNARVIQTRNAALTASGMFLRIRRTGGSYFYETNHATGNTTVASRPLPKDTRHDLRFKLVRPQGGSSGAMTLQTKRSGDSDWVTEIDVAGISGAANDTDITHLEVGWVNAGNVAGTVAATYSIEAVRMVLSSDLADLDLPGDLSAFWRACHALDTGLTQATIRAHIQDGEWASATHARVMYKIGSSATGGSTTTGVAINTFDTHSNHIFTLTGLSPNTNYAGVIQVGNSDFSIVHATSHTFRFRTAPAAGSSAEQYWYVAGCIGQSLDSMPYSQAALAVNEIAALGIVPADMIFNGDWGYESDESTNGRGGSPYETAAGYSKMIYQGYCDDAIHRLSTMGAMMAMPDDHTVINDGDGRMRPGGSMDSTLANDWPDAQGTYGGTVTLGDLAALGLAAHDSYWTNGFLAREVGTEYYGAYTRGRVRTIYYDSRWLRNPDTPTMLGAAQKTWLMDEIAAAGADTQIDVIRLITGGPHGPIGDNSADNFFSVNYDDTKDIVQQCIDELRVDQKWMFIVGDRHMLGGLHRLLPNGTGAGNIDVAEDRFIGEYILCPISKSAFALTSGTSSWANTDAVGPPDRRTWFVNPATAGNPSGNHTQWAHTSGMIFHYRPTLGELDHWFNTAGAAADNLGWGTLVLDVPVASADSPLLLRRREAMLSC